MTYLCAGFIYKSPRLSCECAERMDGIRGRSAAPPIFPLAFATLREAIILTTESREQPFHTRLTGSAVRYNGNYELPTCCQACWVHSQNVHRLREKAGQESAPPHPPSQHTTSEEAQQRIFEMLNMENYHLRFSFFFLNSRIHFRMTSPSCLMLAPQCKNFLFHRSSDNDLNIFGWRHWDVIANIF